MTRATDVIGKAVVSADTGKRLGTVRDLLIDDTGRTLVGLVVKHGVLHGEDVLSADDVQSLGADAIVSRSERLFAAREWRDRQHRHDDAK